MRLHGRGISAVALAAAAVVLAAAPAASANDVPIVVTVIGHGSVTGPGIDCHTGNTGTCNASLAEDQTLNYTATPDPGWAFAHWDGECERTTPVCDVYFGSDSSLSAIFVPTALKLTAGAVTSVPRTPTAGRPFRLILPLTRSDTGKGPTAGKVSCLARVGARPLPTHGGLSRGRAVCSFRIPATARGSRLGVRLSVVVAGASVSRAFAARIA
jgi:hypothetical protein